MATKAENKTINECVDKLQAFRERKELERGNMQLAAHERGVYEVLEDLQGIAEPLEPEDDTGGEGKGEGDKSKGEPKSDS